MPDSSLENAPRFQPEKGAGCPRSGYFSISDAGPYLVLEQVQTNGRLVSGTGSPWGPKDTFSTVGRVPNERLRPIVTIAACKCAFRPSTERATVRNICHDGVIDNDVPPPRSRRLCLAIWSW